MLTTQKEVTNCNPDFYFIDPQYLCEVPELLSYITSEGEVYKTINYLDHPTFTRLREHLASKGLVRIERQACNGDRVLEPFYLNNFLMLEGDKFSCAAVLKNKRQLTDNYNGGNIDPSVKNCN